jgi:hypothetical protein
MTSDREVRVSGGSGIVVGDYAQVFQSFVQSPPSIASYLRVAQFKSLIEERCKGFVGREFVFAGVDRLLQSDEFPSGYVVIRGEPGIGKTAIASKLTLDRGYLHHFNIAPQNVRSPRQFLENICAQLIVRHQLDHPTLTPDAGLDAGLLSQLLAEAAERARERSELPVVVVVDALDEAEDQQLTPGANRLFLPRVLPDGVFFVLTTREVADYRLDVDHLSEIWIRDDDPANQADIARYISGFLDAHAEPMDGHLSAWGLSTAEFVEAVTRLSEGNFMYLVHVLPEIAAGRLSGERVSDISALPRGLDGYYRRPWRDMKDEDPDRFADRQRPVLCLLATSREPVTVNRLVDWTSLDPGAVRSVIANWREFLDEDPAAAPPTYRIYHRSFAEFLDDQEGLRWYHDRIADHALRKLPGFFETP